MSDEPFGVDIRPAAGTLQPLPEPDRHRQAVNGRQPALSVAIIARDEERHIGGALASVVDLASEIVVLLDRRSRDRTASICRAYGVRLYIEPWRGFPAQRNRALELCTGDWVLFLDADERVPAGLAAEIRAVLTADCAIPRPTGQAQGPEAGPQEAAMPPPSPTQPPARSPAGFWIPRDNRFFGKIVRGGGWSPDYQLRLLRRGRAHYDEAQLVHEVAVIDGEAGYLQHPLLHLNIERFDELWRKQRSYAIQEAHALYRQGYRARWRNFIGAPVREFRRRYVQLGGYRDGALGLFLCATLAYFELVKYVHLMALGLLRRAPAGRVKR